MIKGTLIDLLISWKKELNAHYLPPKKLFALADTLQKCLLNETILLKTDKELITFEELSSFGSLELATTVWKQLVGDPNTYMSQVAQHLSPRENFDVSDNILLTMTTSERCEPYLLHDESIRHSLACSSNFFLNYTQMMAHWVNKFVPLGCTHKHLAYLVNTRFVTDYATLYQAFTLAIDLSFSPLCKLLLLSGNPHAINYALVHFNELDIYSDLEILSLIARSGSISAILYTISRFEITDIDPTLLLQSSFTNNPRLFEFLRHVYKLPISTTDKKGWNLIHYAAMQDNLKKLNIFRQEHCHIRLTDAHEHPIHIAAQAGHLHIITALATDSLLLSKTAKNKNILLLAAANGHLHIVKHLAQHKYFEVLKMSTDIDGSNLLHHACQSGNLELVNYVITELAFNVTTPNLYGNNAFHFAARNGHLEILTLLENIEPTVVTGIDSEGQTALFFGIVSDRKDIIFYLIALGLDVNSTNNRRNTPLHVATFFGKTQAIMALLEKDARRDAVNDLHQTPLTFALTHNGISLKTKEQIRQLMN
ncbi:MAG: ankyrin repeat domain-containing protein [Gammaproteobacteria bacterium]